MEFKIAECCKIPEYIKKIKQNIENKKKEAIEIHKIDKLKKEHLTNIKVMDSNTNSLKKKGDTFGIKDEEVQMLINAKDNSFFKKLSKELSIQWTNKLSLDLTGINDDDNKTETAIEVIIFNLINYLFFYI